MNSRWRSAWGEKEWARGSPQVGHMTSSSMSGSEACGAPGAAPANIAALTSAAATQSSSFITDTVPPRAGGGNARKGTAARWGRTGGGCESDDGRKRSPEAGARAIRSPRVLKEAARSAAYTL